MQAKQNNHEKLVAILTPLLNEVLADTCWQYGSLLPGQAISQKSEFGHRYKPTTQATPYTAITKSKTDDYS